MLLGESLETQLEEPVNNEPMPFDMLPAESSVPSAFKQRRASGARAKKPKVKKALSGKMGVEEPLVNACILVPIDTHTPASVQPLAHLSTVPALPDFTFNFAFDSPPQFEEAPQPVALLRVSPADDATLLRSASPGFPDVDNFPTSQRLRRAPLVPELVFGDDAVFDDLALDHVWTFLDTSPDCLGTSELCGITSPLQPHGDSSHATAPPAAATNPLEGLSACTEVLTSTPDGTCQDLLPHLCVSPDFMAFPMNLLQDVNTQGAEFSHDCL
jgi:hypothetical protein